MVGFRPAQGQAKGRRPAGWGHSRSSLPWRRQRPSRGGGVMKRIVALAVLGAALVVGVQPAQAGIQRFSSNTTWHVFTGVPPNGPLGNAQFVCLQATPPPSPANCPAGAVDYMFGAGWTAPLTSIPHAF